MRFQQDDGIIDISSSATTTTTTTTTTSAAAANNGNNVLSMHLRHPYGVLPEGNRLSAGGSSGCARRSTDPRRMGLGTMTVLPDVLILEILSRLDGRALCCLAHCSRALYVFSHVPDLWRALSVARFRRNQTQGGGDSSSFRFVRTWKETWLTAEGIIPPLPAQSETASSPTRAGKVEEKKGGSTCIEAASSATQLYASGTHGALRPISVSGLYSDLIFRAWLSATVVIDEAAWCARDNIPRVSDLDAAQFRTQYEMRRRPVVLTGLAQSWPALAHWDTSYLASVHGAACVQAFDEYLGALDVPLSAYLEYATTCVTDERPLYVFEPSIEKSAPALLDDFTVPPHFSEDLFSLLGDEARPDYRWLLVGPARTGTNFHVDPNHTAAWNTVLRGRKKWIMFPPDQLPPGVHVESDGRVVQADSPAEWMVRYYASLQEQQRGSGIGAASSSPISSSLECVCGPGDTVYIPDGWWHMVINLEPTVALTQNYVSTANVQRVRRYLATRDPPHMTFAGDANTQEKFEAALKAKRPDLAVEPPVRKPVSIWAGVSASAASTTAAVSGDGNGNGGDGMKKDSVAVVGAVQQHQHQYCMSERNSSEGKERSAAGVTFSFGF